MELGVRLKPRDTAEGCTVPTHVETEDRIMHRESKDLNEWSH